MKGLYKKHRMWWLRYSMNGRQIRESLGTRDEAEAIREAEKRLNAPAKTESADYKTEIAAYLRERRKADRLSRHSVENRDYVLPRFFEQSDRLKMVRNVTRADAQAWYDGLKIAEETRQTYVRWLKAFFKWLIDKNKLRENPFAALELARARPKSRRHTLTKAQVQKLIDEAPSDELRFVLYCGFHAGMRKEEVIEARPEWFDLASGHIHIGPTDAWIPKDRERRAVPISKAFREFLKGYGLPAPYMIGAHKPRRGRARYRYDFRRAYNDHLKRCGIQCSFHDARRTFASLLVSAGVSIYKVAKWLGDGVAVVEKHYGHLTPDSNALDGVF